MTSVRSNKLTWTLLAVFGVLLTGYAVTAGTLESYGSLFIHNDTGETQTIILGAYNNISVWELGERYAMNASTTFLTPRVSGTYLVHWALSFSGGGNQEYQVTVLVNGAEQGACEAHRKMGNLGDVGSTAGTCIINLTVGELVSLGIEDEDTPVADATIYAGNLNVVKIR